MSDIICFSLIPEALPVVSSLDRAFIKPPYVHFHRQYHEYILYYILSGELFLTEGNRSYHLKENHFILLDPSREHFGQKPSTCQFFYIHFSLPDLAETTLTKEALQDLLQTEHLTDLKIKKELPSQADPSLKLYIPKCHLLNAPAPISQIHYLITKLSESFISHEFYHHQEVSCLLYELLIAVSKDFSHELLYGSKTTASAFNQTVPMLLNFLQQSYSANLSSVQIEAKFNCNFDHLNRQFKKMTGQTIFAYLNKLRIEKAKQLLTTGFYTVTEVASRTGFHDVYYFSKVFKKLTGTTPGKFGKSI